MRIFAISDLHADRNLARIGAEQASLHGADLVMLAGDLSLFGSEFEGIIAPFTELNVPILLLGGNHDDHERVAELAASYGAVHLDGYGVVIGGVGFIGTRGITLGGSRQTPEEMRDSLLTAARYARAERIVMMTHGHPSGTLMSQLSSYVRGSETIEELIHTIEPSLHVCGHVHEGAGLIESIGQTKVVNVSRIPTLIDLADES